MLVRPSREDLHLIGSGLANVATAMGAVMLVPSLVAVVRGEWNAATSLLIGASLGIAVGRIGAAKLRSRRHGQWTHHMVLAGGGWLIGALLGAVPLYLSGHVGGYLDAVFESMSGLTTTGLSLTQDLDHLAVSMNLWRHLLQLVGGQAFIVVVLTLFAVSGTQAAALSVGAMRDVRLLPSIASTVRSVATVAVAFAVVGVTALTVAGLAAGLPPLRAVLHGVALFTSAYDTGGFALHSSSVGFYHSPTLEGVLVVLMLAGALSHALHLQLQQRNWWELVRNIEARTFAASFLVLATVTFVGLGRSGAFTTATPMFRRGFFTLVSAHTTTGLTITDGRVMASDWGLIVPAALVAAMAVGGMSASTAGGIKAVRVGVTAKGIAGEVRRVLLPEAALTVSTYHQLRRHVLRDDHVRAAATVLLLFLFTYLIGGIVTLFYRDVDFTTAMFESTAAAANGGMSVGVTHPGLPAPVRSALLLQMWLGRLEFLAVFAVVGYVVALARGRT